MLEKPNLSDDIIVAALRAGYGLAVRALEFLPLGNDARAWSYRVKAPAATYFLKLRKGSPKPASLAVPHYLQQNGIANIVAPLETSSGRLTFPVDGYSLILFPFVEGRSEWNMPMRLPQWRAWGRIMRAIHDMAITSELAESVARAAFAENWLGRLARVESAVMSGAFGGDYAEAAAQIWRIHAREVVTARERYLSLGAQLAARSLRFVICHADIHRANIIIDKRDDIRIVDWDETVLAPKERDLMFFLGDGHDRQVEAAFLQGYGECTVDRIGLAYYRYDWVLQEFVDYGERLFLSPTLARRIWRSRSPNSSRLVCAGRCGRTRASSICHY